MDPIASIHNAGEEQTYHRFPNTERKLPLDEEMAQHLSTVIYPKAQK